MARHVNDTWPSWPTCFVSDVVEKDTEVTDPDEGKSQTFFSELEEKFRNPKASETRKKWSADEEEEIKALFKKFFDLKKRPTPADCLKAKKRSKRENGFIHERKKDVLKKK
ncbi:hypothetical protein DPMN_118541 [Dreissena polymorpha]|uniref:Uncharacterized protein n=1 Tax=Dreissena polymorpha TaxID=45954 RepID=A0A9D4GH54_DREPO|nr:hypothetical protein DPMN_118541 [Dreissena polymorpha]